jgi:hypothetical protein
MEPSSWGETPKNLPLATKATTTATTTKTTWETQEVPMAT